MRFIKPLILFISVFTVSALAETTGPTPPQQPAPKEVRVVLSKQTGNKPFRAPSLTPTNQIVGLYTEDGTLSAYIPEDSTWEMVIGGVDGETYTYFVSTLDLHQGVRIGTMSGFSISITNDSGITYIGEVCP